MIGALIKYKGKIMFAGLPKDSESLNNQFSRIGLDISPYEIKLTSNNNYGYEIEIYGQDSAEIAICARICSSDTLGQLNELMQYLDNNEVEDLYEVVVDGDSESISELYKEITTPPELETTDKLVIRTTLNYKANFYEPADCIVEKAIVIPHDEYEALVNITDGCYDFIAENQEYMYYDKDNNNHCILIYDDTSGDGVIINADGCNYPKYSAFVPHAKTMIEQHELEKSGLTTVNAPITESEKRLLDTISSVADRIATFAHLGHKDFTIEDVLKDLDCDYDDIHRLIRCSVAEILNEKPDISTVKVCDLELPFQPEITVTTEETQEQTADDEEFSGLSL